MPFLPFAFLPFGFGIERFIQNGDFKSFNVSLLFLSRDNCVTRQPKSKKQREARVTSYLVQLSPAILTCTCLGFVLGAIFKL